MGDNDEKARASEDREDADARNRAVGGADETRHVAADRRDQESAEEDEGYCGDDERRRLRREQRGLEEVEQDIGDDRETDEREQCDRAEAHVGVAAVCAALRAST